MALTPTVQFKTVFGNQRVVLGTLAFDASATRPAAKRRPLRRSGTVSSPTRTGWR